MIEQNIIDIKYPPLLQPPNLRIKHYDWHTDIVAPRNGYFYNGEEDDHYGWGCGPN